MHWELMQVTTPKGTAQLLPREPLRKERLGSVQVLRR